VKIKDIPWYDRSGARLTREGVEKLSNSDLLEVILGERKNKPRESVITLVSRILSKYNLHKLEDLGLKELKKECKGDIVPALKILSFIELSKRYNKLVKGGFNKKPINSAKDVYDMFVDEMRSYKKEVLKVVLLDTKNVPISVKDVSVGTLNSSLIHPREVFKDAIKESANSIILVHNHPSGSVDPSEEDLEMTKKLIEVGKLMKIPVVDHIIIGDKKFWNWLDQS
tara:strand:+ start:3289 stop:3966 length:678 start_codon:yes stop_codon:yes gene_type:complete